MISLSDDFNTASLHNPSPEALKYYEDIPEIRETDIRGYPMVRPLFSHSNFSEYLNLRGVHIDNFSWDSEFIYPVLLHHNNLLCAKYLHILPNYVLKNLKSRKCKLILDNTLEGDQVQNFYQELHKSILELNIPASQIYYVTNSLVAEYEYEAFVKNSSYIKEKVNVISFMYNVMDVQRLIKEGHLPVEVNIEEEIKYKRDNIEKVKPFLKLNRTGRPERNLFMLYINRHRLFDKFKLSFPEYPDYEFTEYIKQKFPRETLQYNINNLREKCPFDIDQSDSENHGPPGVGKGFFDADKPFDPVHYRQTVLSFILCAFPFVPGACHLHSSTFNPIYCGHPIVQFGPYRHLEILKRYGFRTFDKWWDESYDNYEEGWERLDNIFKVLNFLSKKSVTDLIDMYEDMKDVLQHNSDLIKNYNGKELLIKRILHENNL